MLVLSRKLDEEIAVGGNVRIKVLRIGRGQVSLGIMAPREIPVHRGEVADKIEREKGTPPCAT